MKLSGKLLPYSSCKACLKNKRRPGISLHATFSA